MRVGDLKLVSAHSLPLSQLASLFNAAYSDYPVTMAFDENGIRRHVSDNDINLEVSQVALAPGPVGLVLVGRRGREAWVGGVGTVLEYRRRGVAERTLQAGLRTAASDGAEICRLEVLQENKPAISLYRRLGFETTRRLIVCSLRDLGPPRTDWRPISVDDARGWIGDERLSREPWQRDDRVLRRISETGRPLAAIGISGRAGGLSAALVYAGGPAGTSIIQMAARDEVAAAEGLRAAVAALGGPVLLVNFPANEPVAAGVTRLGVTPDHVQHEMELRLVSSPA